MTTRSLKRLIHGGCLLAAAVLLSGAIAGCGGTKSSGPAGTTPLAGNRAQQAEHLLSQVRDYDLRGRWSQVVRTTGVLLDYYGDDPRCADALVLAVPAALQAGDPDDALQMAGRLAGDFGGDPRLLPTLAGARDIAVSGRDTVTAAAFEVMMWRRDPAWVLPDSAVVSPLPLVSRLDGAGLDRLARLFPGPDTAGLLGYHRVLVLSRLGRKAEAAALAQTLAASLPGERWAAAAVAAATGGSLSEAIPGPAAGPRKIGLLVPLTGRYAGYGNAMDEAARLAIAHVSTESDMEIVLEDLDTGADPVTAAHMARRLCADPAVEVIVGALRTGTTVAAALVASGRGVPLVSPTASNERIATLGGGIYQTNLDDQREVMALADLAVDVLLKKRLAILGPDTPTGHHLADLFAGRVDTLGGMIVAEAYFPPSVTDFRAQILEIRRREPEAVFVPCTFEQMTLLGPQLDFHHLGALVLGPGAWSTVTPSKQQAAAFEGVIFPDAQARFPSSWVEQFSGGWPRDVYSAEQTTVARMTYLAVRQVVATCLETGCRGREDLARALAARLSAGGDQAGGGVDLDRLGQALRLVRKGRTLVFPAALFRPGMAAADTVTAEAGEDSLSGSLANPLGGGAEATDGSR